jgi:hypothetical protein
MSLIGDRTPLVNPLTIIDIDTTDFPLRFVHFLWVALDVFVAGIEMLRLLLTIQVESDQNGLYVLTLGTIS